MVRKTKYGNHGMMMVPVNLIHLPPSRLDIRATRDVAGLKDLADSLSRKGMLQNIILRKMPSGRLEVIGGGRRFRSAKMAGQKDVPARVFENISDKDAIIIALIEGVHQERYEALDEARAYKMLRDEFKLSTEAIAQQVGKPLMTVKSRLSYLELPEETQEAITNHELSTKHATQLIKLRSRPEAQKVLTRKIVTEGLSTKEVKAFVDRTFSTEESKTKRSKRAVVVKQPAPTSEVVTERQIRFVTLQGSTLLGTLDQAAIGYWPIGKLKMLQRGLLAIQRDLQVVQSKIEKRITELSMK